MRHLLVMLVAAALVSPACGGGDDGDGDADADVDADTDTDGDMDGDIDGDVDGDVDGDGAGDVDGDGDGDVDGDAEGDGGADADQCIPADECVEGTGLCCTMTGATCYPTDVCDACCGSECAPHTAGCM